jgi:hypothetical protein
MEVFIAALDSHNLVTFNSFFLFYRYSNNIFFILYFGQSRHSKSSFLFCIFLRSELTLPAEAVFKEKLGVWKPYAGADYNLTSSRSRLLSPAFHPNHDL